MEQPSMKEIIVNEAIILAALTPSSYLEIDYPNPLAHLSTLTLKQTSINQHNLSRLLRACSHLRHLTLTRPRFDANGVPDLSDLAETLKHNAPNLHSLHLGYGHSTKIREFTLLGTLTSLRDLKTLRVEPSMFLGRRVSQYFPHPRPAGSVGMWANEAPLDCLAQLPPSSIENFILDIDMEQVKQNPKYSVLFVKSLIAAQAKLKNLQEIVLVENPATNMNWCGCGGGCYRQAVVTAQQRQEIADEKRQIILQLRRPGMKLYRDVCDGTGQVEVPAWNRW
jgi:hypothetical protein